MPSFLQKVTPYLPPILTDLLKKFLPKKGKSSAKKRPVPSRAPQKVSKSTKSLREQTSSSMAAWRWVAIVFAFLFAGMGQYFWMQSSVPKTFGFGFIPFTLAVLLFLVALQPWKRENLSNAPLPPMVEYVSLGLILLVAAFFRLYRLGEIPNGMFMDQGNMGLFALKIRFESVRPFFEIPEFENPALLLYNLAAWFFVFPATKYGFYLFFAALGLATIPLAYWTLRQLTGPRVALLSMFVFAVMRWHFNFCRNGFPTVQVPFYMFGTLGFLLYGLRTGKRWAFVTSALFFSLGLYTYNAFKLFPLLMLVLGAYELIADRPRMLKNKWNILLFTLLTAVLVSPLALHWAKNGIGGREASNSILTDIKGQKSMKPVWHMLKKTTFMFNREGDDNERHNLANHRMLDDVSGSLFVLGLFYALLRANRRKYFYALAGVAVMSLPCLLSVVPAHANRMLGITVFVAFLIATPLAAVWGRIRAKWGSFGEVAFVLFIALGLLWPMAMQNFQVYFVKQTSINSYWETSFWGGYSIDASQVGAAVAREADAYDFVMFTRLATHPTVNFLGYKYRDHIRTMKPPEGLTPGATASGRGLCFALLGEHEGYLRTLKALYPEGKTQDFKDLNGRTYLYLFRVPAEAVEKAKGLRSEGGRDFSRFPESLPPGPYRETLRGSLLVPSTGRYHLRVDSNADVSVRVGGADATGLLALKKGFYPVEIDLAVPSGDARLKLSLVSVKGTVIDLPASSWTSLRVGGLEATYYPVNEWKGDPALVQIDPMVNFVNGTDFPYTNWQMSVRWEGTLLAPTSGEYTFTTQTEEKTALYIDGREVIRWNRSPRNGKVYLSKGAHTLRLDFEKILGPTLSLLWKEPGSVTACPVPNTAFGLPSAGR